MNSNLISTAINQMHSHTNHSNKRSKQRGVNNESILFLQFKKQWKKISAKIFKKRFVNEFSGHDKCKWRGRYNGL